MSDQPTPEEWRADLAALNDAIGVVKRESGTITTTMSSIDAKVKQIGADWSSPSHESFAAMMTWFHKVQHELDELLKDIASRMTTSYNNYHDSEHVNLNNLSDGGPHG
ncbi:WXG100 family type VII secretion target [Streptomyces sp. CBMA29]|uniref:WXG100 family type VII secretion target n=1 Tax=Streptomyces sp. CBMA29 TaxID=1896314 RepID=UPI00166218F9|nr:WXG100 family type VII secretion target [Streptomyces sp. CBMA29]MBD0736464.1 hypothetical protein [Streptomyces sp. CBMA29]